MASLKKQKIKKMLIREFFLDQYIKFSKIKIQTSYFIKKV